MTAFNCPSTHYLVDIDQLLLLRDILAGENDVETSDESGQHDPVCHSHSKATLGVLKLGGTSKVQHSYE